MSWLWASEVETRRIALRVIGRAMVMDYGVMKALAVNDYYADVGT